MEEEVRLEILGGLVVTVLYNSPRTTSDVDAISIVPNTQSSKLMKGAGEGSPLHKKYGVYLDWVGIATLTENYDERLTEVFDGEFQNLRFFAVDPYDLLIAKIERNIDRDREDVLFQAEAANLDLKVPEERYFIILDAKKKPHFFNFNNDPMGSDGKYSLETIKSVVRKNRKIKVGSVECREPTEEPLDYVRQITVQ